MHSSSATTQIAATGVFAKAAFGKIALVFGGLAVVGANWATNHVRTGNLVYEVSGLTPWPLLETPWLYAALLVFTIAFPLGASFDPRFSYYKKWRYLLPGLLGIGAVFICWDVHFTKVGVWGFNDRYLTGVRLSELPWEEWAFFACVPFSCVFILESVRYFAKRKLLEARWRTVTALLTVLFFGVGLLHWERMYTSTTFLLCGFLNLYLLVFAKNARLGQHYVAYLFCLIPFLLVNGVLTGSLTAQPVVVYNPEEFMGLRIVTIPAEDAAYGYLLLMGNFLVYDFFLKGRRTRA